ncbi:ATP-binding protein [Streptomyces sp. NPDC089919]|uniref:ATP-binding protein n=1 Tax=Streptomyces sp. NPDC089919 TaxID=3155188 RepID=UPI0034458F4A
MAGDFVLTVNPVDGSEIENRGPAAEPPARTRRATGSRTAIRTAARPPAPSGPPAPMLPLLEREEERERLVRLLSRGRSVRLTGPAGSGRTSLLDAVADDCADLAPDGVIRLSGLRQGATDLLYALHAAVYDAPGYRPDKAELLDRVREIGAVVFLDDVEFGGSALDELLLATPECAFLVTATPDTPAPDEASHLEEVFLGGLGRTACAVLLAAAVGRKLTEEETSWAGDLWFASEGLPLRFVQAGALLRQRDELSGPAAPAEDGPDADDEPGVFTERPRPPALPALAESAAPAELLAGRLSDNAREALRFAVALGGELPHQAHLPALIGDTHADTAVGELLGCGLIGAAGARYRLATGVQRQLTEAGYADQAPGYALTAAQHYAWWTGHSSVAPERAAAEADAVLAALAGVLAAVPEEGRASAAVLLARTAAPAFAGGLQWGAWERVLRAGQEAARIAGEVAEEAYFHHELGILALCNGLFDRARAELEASIGLRGALADKRGMVAGRRALALVSDRTGGPLSPPLVLAAPAGSSVPASEARTELLPPLSDEPEPVAKVAFPRLALPKDVTATPPAPVPPLVAAGPPAGPPAGPGSGPAPGPAPVPAGGRVPSSPTVVTRVPGAARDAKRAVLTGTRRNVLAAAAGAVLVAVLGTVLTLGMTSNAQEDPSKRARDSHSVTEDDGSSSDVGDDADPGASPDDEPGRTDGPTRESGRTGEPTPGPTRTARETGEPSGDPSPSGRPSSHPPTSTAPTGPTGSPDPTGPTGEPTEPTEPTDEPTEPTDPPKPTDTAPTGGGNATGGTQTQATE